MDDWVAADLVRNSINDPRAIEALLSMKLHYVVAFDENGRAKDVTGRSAQTSKC